MNFVVTGTVDNHRNYILSQYHWYYMYTEFDQPTPKRHENMIAVPSVVGMNTKAAIKMARSK